MSDMTVSCKLVGGTGNCLFILAATVAYSLRHNCDYCIPTVIENPHSPNQKVFYSPNLKYCEYGMRTMTTIQEGGYGYALNVVYTEPFFHFKEIPKYDCNKLHLRGYFQSEKYFSEYRNEILKILDIPYVLHEFKYGWCSIHVRRNDYLKLENFHPVITNEYIQEAQIRMMNNGIFNFFVVSDDIEWCKKSMCQFDKCNYIFSENKTDVEDLSLASSCEHNIGSNSSFSWWIYWLNRNENKIGIFPEKSKWFGESLPNNVDDLYMPQWTLI